ncbi:MAG TPA: four helix bundle protein [Smithellaceae bacterium]|nr:four helix bundle protein [Smithellaceae bacterium]HPL67952.1 four helix bundle protein [Smithellaceae bacterium]
MKDYKELEVWEKGILLVLKIYETTKNFPKDERFALTDQIKRASVSIPSNIAEGASRNTTKEFVQFLYIALGSASELETQIIIAEKLGYLRSEETLYAEITVIRKMLNALITSLKKIVNGG